MNASIAPVEVSRRRVSQPPGQPSAPARTGIDPPVPGRQSVLAASRFRRSFRLLSSVPHRYDPDRSAFHAVEEAVRTHENFAMR
jgi:hypothetical protein